MQIVIRADASATIGTGHVMRCLTLAGALRILGADVRFVTNRGPGNLFAQIEQSGFLAYTVDCVSDELGDPNALIELACRERLQPDWIVIDHYGADTNYETALRRVVRRIMVIDDLANRKHDCDVLLDVNFHKDALARYRGLVSSVATVLAGPEYALIRPEFVESRSQVSARKGPVRHVVISFGGADPVGMSIRSMDAIRHLRPDVRVTVVIGAACELRDEIRAKAIELNIVVAEGVSISRLFASADLGIGAPGGTTWERFCVGLPSVLIAIADNQFSVGTAVGDAKYAIYAGPAEDVTDGALERNLRNILDDEELRHGLSLRSMQLVDGKGANRVAETIVGIQ
jgi:UDP-2,4-diacetamido-2,4,6-trideoxy-beta-L-altropyranose hydrolase